MSDAGSVLYNNNKKNNSKKNQDGESIIAGILIGKVCSNYNPLQKDKVQVEIPIGGTGKTTKVWAKFMMPTGGNKWGMYWKPEVGDHVVISFINGNVNRPFVLGCAYPSNADMIGSYNTMLNTKKAIKTKSGSEIKIETAATGDSISVKTLKGNKVVIEDAQNQISLETLGGNKITINGATGAIQVKGNTSIELSTGASSIKLEATGKITINSTNISVNGTAKTEVKGNKLELSGTQVNIKSNADMKLQATAGLKAQSTATVEVKGGMIKLN